jgi:serine/threonine protein kinase
VAVKVMKCDNGIKRVHVEELLHLASLNHPNVISIIGVCYDPYCIFTELMHTDLGKLLHDLKVRLDAQQTWHIALQLIRGIQALHEHEPLPKMHRDLKVVLHAERAQRSCRLSVGLQWLMMFPPACSDCACRVPTCWSMRSCKV